MYSELSPNQAKAVVDSEQIYRAYQDTLEKMLPYKGGMHWKTISGHQYLYRTVDSKGTAKSLGRRSDETEALYSQFHQRKEELAHRLSSQRQRLEEQIRMAKALRVGSAPRVLAEVCRALCEHDLMKVLRIPPSPGGGLARQAEEGGAERPIKAASPDIK